MTDIDLPECCSQKAGGSDLEINKLLDDPTLSNGIMRSYTSCPLAERTSFLDDHGNSDLRMF